MEIATSLQITAPINGAHICDKIWHERTPDFFCRIMLWTRLRQAVSEKSSLVPPADRQPDAPHFA
jgi:hypothetical protein